MTPFTIVAKPPFLTLNIQGFYHTDFGGVELPNNPNYLYKLKNDPHHKWSEQRIHEAQNQLLNVLLNDLPKVLIQVGIRPLTVCVVPRAKADNNYRANQLLFKETVKNAIIQLGNDFIDRTHYITRHTNTRTTHLRMAMDGFVNDGKTPYAGITIDTCNISNQVCGKNILLIDDIYTNNVNIDEDAIQALLTNRAKSVTFYAIGKTIARY